MRTMADSEILLRLVFYSIRAFFGGGGGTVHRLLCTLLDGLSCLLGAVRRCVGGCLRTIFNSAAGFLRRLLRSVSSVFHVLSCGLSRSTYSKRKSGYTDTNAMKNFHLLDLSNKS